MRIVVCCHTAGLAGAELAIAESCRALHGQGHQVFVVVPEAGPFIAHVAPWTAGHQIIAQDHWTGTAALTPWQKLKFVRGFLGSAIKIARYARAVRADLVITNTSTIPAGALGAALARVPHIWYVHEFVQEDHGLVWQYGQRPSYMIMHRLSRGLIVNSVAVRHKLERFMPRHKLSVVYCACDIDWEPLAPDALPNAPVLLMAGALSEGKNQALAISALAEPPLAQLGARMACIGNGAPHMLAGLRDLARSLGVADRLEIHPHQADRRAVFAKGRLLVVASRAEAFGRVTVEAQKSGLPVLVADAGAAREVVADGQTGLLFEPGQAEDLAAKAAQLLADPEGWATIRKAALDSATKRFSLQTHAEQLAAAIAAAR